MTSKHALATIVAIALVGTVVPAQAHHHHHHDRHGHHCDRGDPPCPRIQDADIYGYDLMTEQERSQYRERMLNADGAAERARIAAIHREEMQARAKQRGVPLEEPE